MLNNDMTIVQLPKLKVAGSNPVSRSKSLKGRQLSAFFVKTWSHMPHVIVIAGPNGAGKSTTAPAILQGALGVTEFVNADTIAAGL